jgi:hypothetical protein
MLFGAEDKCLMWLVCCSQPLGSKIDEVFLKRELLKNNTEKNIFMYRIVIH